MATANVKAEAWIPLGSEQVNIHASIADTRVIYRRLSPVGYYNQPLAANGNRREGTASK